LGKPAVVGTLHLRLDEEGLTLSATQPPELAFGEEAERAAGEGLEAEGIMAEEGLVEEGIEVRSGSLITVDGTNGVIYLGEMPTVRLGQDADFQSIMVWGDR
jgi:phosphoenolpyruvate synthase/pyruvate phosphate dikinase